MASIKVLLVEDDERLAQLTARYLESHGVLVTIAATGTEGQVEALRRQYDCIVLDVMLPGRDGIEVTRELRARTDVPIVMVTARTEEADRVLGLEVGADDYVTKPFSPRELIARIRAVVRRGRQADAKEKKANLKAGDLEIDRYRFEVRMKGRPIELTPTEFELLATLVGTPGRVFGREELLDIVWGRDGFVEPRTVDVHVARLRGKFTAAKAEEPGIETVRGVGSRFRDSKP